MAVLGSILPVVSQSSALALELYRIAASSHIGTATELIRTAKLINGFASTLKQVGTIVKEDDRLPSHEVGIRSSISLALWCLKIVTRDFVKAIAVPKSLRWILIQPGDKSLYTVQIWYCINLHVPTTYRSQTNDPVP
jgi:hypothetical protein